MNIKQHILTARYINANGKSKNDNQLFVGTSEEAREAAQKFYNLLDDSSCRHIRVEIWETVAMSYKGAIREVRK